MSIFEVYESAARFRYPGWSNYESHSATPMTLYIWYVEPKLVGLGAFFYTA